MKMRVSSILFALSIFSGAAHADEFTTVDAALTYDTVLLTSEDGAAIVLADLERQARSYCRKVTLTSVGLVVDEVCAEDILFQAVDQIGSDHLKAQYAGSDYFVETVSERLQFASN